VASIRVDFQPTVNDHKSRMLLTRIGGLKGTCSNEISKLQKLGDSNILLV